MLFDFGGVTLLGETDPDIRATRRGYVVVRTGRVAHEVPAYRVRRI